MASGNSYDPVHPADEGCPHEKASQTPGVRELVRPRSPHRRGVPPLPTVSLAPKTCAMNFDNVLYSLESIRFMPVL
ncbi:MAG TPA: hypothetical protein VL485_25085 [Ktedonobacteraceae bacterium]|nr:hypothetical protein [Ktedonobacteraceae bacterium]